MAGRQDFIKALKAWSWGWLNGEASPLPPLEYLRGRACNEAGGPPTIHGVGGLRFDYVISLT